MWPVIPVFVGESNLTSIKSEIKKSLTNKVMSEEAKEKYYE